MYSAVRDTFYGANSGALQRCSNLIFTLFLVGFISFSIIFLGLSLQPFALVCVGFFSLFCVCVRLRTAFQCDSFTPLLVLGILVPLLPATGSGALLLAALVYALIFNTNRLQADLRWAAPFLLLLSMWVAASWVIEFDLDYWRAAITYQQLGYGQHGINSLSRFFRLNTPAYVVSTIALLRLGLLCIFVSRFSSIPEHRTQFLKGIVVGVFAVIPLLIFQLWNPGSGWFVGETEFWSALNRFPATFSDPNSFGVFFILFLPLIAHRIGLSRCSMSLCFCASVLFLCAYLFAGTYSGSRSFFLGALIYAFISLFLLRKKPAFWLVPVACLFLVLGLGVGLVDRVGTFLVSAEYLPEGIRRLQQALDLAQLSQTFHSRIVFFEVTFAVWCDHWLFGVGYNTFRTVVVSYADLLQLGTGTWSDNANSFYMGVLSELGLVGVLACVLSIANLRIRRNGLFAFRAALVCLVLLLCLGPHIEFDEIALLSALVIGGVVSIKPSRIVLSSSGSLTVFVILSAAVLFQAHSTGRGFYPWEMHSGSFYRWSTGRSFAYFPCDERGRAEVQFKVVHPDLSELPVTVDFSSPGQPLRSFFVTNPLNGRAVFYCPAVPDQTPGLFVPPESIPVEINVSRLWIPETFGIGADPRPLGIQVFGVKPGDTVS